jgi:hypothetical protein
MPMPPETITFTAREVAKIFEKALRSLGLPAEDLGRIAPTACGLLLGRMSLTPDRTAALATQAFHAGLLERQSQ